MSCNTFTFSIFYLVLVITTTTTMGNSFSVLSFAPVGDKSADAESVLIWNKVASRALGETFPNEKDHP
jgi:hypothetical protein